MPPEQRDRPLRREVTQFLGRPLQDFKQPGPALGPQQAGSARAILVVQGVGVVVLRVSPDPGIDDTGGHPQASSDGVDRLALSNFEQGQGAAIDASIAGVPKLSFQATPLPGSQAQDSVDSGLCYFIRSV